LKEKELTFVFRLFLQSANFVSFLSALESHP